MAISLFPASLRVRRPSALPAIASARRMSATSPAILDGAQPLDRAAQRDKVQPGERGSEIAVSRNGHPVGLEAEAGDPRVPNRRGDRLDGSARVLEEPGAAHLAATLGPVAEVGEEHHVARGHQQRPGRAAEAAEPAHVGQVGDQGGGEPPSPEGRAQTRDAPRVGAGGAHEARSEATARRASR